MTTDLTILHLNDTHSQFDEQAVKFTLPVLSRPIYIQCGGFSRVATVFKQIKEQASMSGTPVLCFHAGDCFQGSQYFSLYKGKANAVLWNAIGIDAMALGNHELDMGNRLVADFLDLIDFPVLAANWDLSHEDPNKANPLALKTNLLCYDSDKQCGQFLVHGKGKERIAVFGLTLENMAQVASPDPDTLFLPIVDVAEKTIAEIHRQGIQRIIVLSHLGYERDKWLALAVTDIDLIIGGHTHTFQGDFQSLGLGEKDQYALTVGSTVVVQSGCNALLLGQLSVTFDDDDVLQTLSANNQWLLGHQFSYAADGSDPLSDEDLQQALEYLLQQESVAFYEKDLVVEQLLDQQYRPALIQSQQRILTTVTEPLRHVRVPDNRGGSDVAPWVAESFLWCARHQGIPTDVAIHNAGGVRASLNAGKLSEADVSGKLLPFAIDIMTYRLAGKHLRLMLEGAINNAVDNGVEGTGTGSFPYVAGCRFSYRCCAEEGKRIQTLDIFIDDRWSAIEDDRIYGVVSSAYTVMGKEGYHEILQMESAPYDLNITMAEAFCEYVQHQIELTKPMESFVHYIPCEGCE